MKDHVIRTLSGGRPIRARYQNHHAQRRAKRREEAEQRQQRYDAQVDSTIARYCSFNTNGYLPLGFAIYWDGLSPTQRARVSESIPSDTLAHLNRKLP